jgi:hypothetical protein
LGHSRPVTGMLVPLWSFKNFDAHKQENVLYHICGVLCRFTIEGNIDRCNVNTSKSGLVHDPGDRWFNDVRKIIIVYFEDHTNRSICCVPYCSIYWCYSSCYILLPLGFSRYCTVILRTVPVALLLLIFQY